MESRVVQTAREALGDLESYLAATSDRRFERRRSDTLTSREREVLMLLADGQTTEQVADELCVSPHTVRSRVKSSLAKLDARTREHAIAIVIREGAF